MRELAGDSERILGRVVLVASFILLSCQRQADEDFAAGANQKRLGGAELRAALSGNTATGRTFGWPDRRFLTFYGGEGSCKTKTGLVGAVDIARSGPARTGTWRVSSDGALCDACGGGRETCERVYTVHGKLYGYGSTGTLSRTFRILPGDRTEG